jgi:plasmid maintenance system antidote protein VapI
MTSSDAAPFDNFGILGIFDPGDCLRHCFRELKRAHPGATHRYIAAAIGMKSSAAFTLLIRGRIHPTTKVIDSLAKVFGLRQEERDHLALLFELRRMRDASARRIVRELVLERRKTPSVFTNG